MASALTVAVSLPLSVSVGLALPDDADCEGVEEGRREEGAHPGVETKLCASQISTSLSQVLRRVKIHDWRDQLGHGSALIERSVDVTDDAVEPFIVGTLRFPRYEVGHLA